MAESKCTRHEVQFRGMPNDTNTGDVTFPVTWLILIGLHDISDVKWRPP